MKGVAITNCKNSVARFRPSGQVIGRLRAFSHVHIEGSNLSVAEASFKSRPMGYEIDFLPVGTGEKSGDAIAIRHGNLYGSRSEQRVIIIDGGTKDSGQRQVEHVLNYYNTDRVDLVVNSHPDGDHASGLSIVLEELDVRQVWMHQPWNHSGKIRQAFSDGRITNDGLSARFQKALSDAREIERIALLKGIPITEPFTGVGSQADGLFVLGPSRDYYQSLLPDFDCMPDQGSATQSIFGRVSESIKAAAESWGYETLQEPGETRAENNSSTILLLRVDGRDLLFTADAGVPALEQAADLADQCGINLQNCAFQQVPHHGSKRNVGPEILNRIVGAKGTPANGKMVFVSAGPSSPKHPSKKVTNAYQRRGATVSATQGISILHSHNSPPRVGWGPIAPLPFYSEVED